MNKQRIKEIIIDQKETYLSLDYKTRDYTLDKNVNYCFVGIRRCGKSYLMYQLIHEVINSGVDEDKIIYINFQDERLLEFESSDFNKLLEIAEELANRKSSPYLFLDEIQLVDGWEKFVRRIADMKYHISVTGSNSKMLSKEIASTLGGRFMIVNVYPYSFSEYLNAININKKNLGVSTKSKAILSSSLNQFLTYGAFPELINISNKRDYLNSIYQTIYLGDIIVRNGLDNKFALRLILKKIAESVMNPISYSRLYGITKSSGIGIGKQTVINYVGFSLDAQLIFQIQNYAAKLVEKEASPKYYFTDTGLLNLFEKKNSLSAQLENAVAIELIRRYGLDNVYYYNKNIDIDFYIPETNTAIQVSYDIDNDDTFKREIDSLVKFKTYFNDAKCIVITMDEEKNIVIDGVSVTILSLSKWFLNNN